LSLEKKTCNEHIVNSANVIFEHFQSFDFKSNPKSDYLKIQIEKNVYFENKDTKRSVFYLNLLNYFKTMKIEENFNCIKSSE
jgi:hypothetical protein